MAANYLKSCNALWIVAPITRAVDDKTAKSLLGDSFKRQLKYDGTYSTVTFICSKTDDISITEAAESLDMEDDIGECFMQVEGLETTGQSLKQELDALKEGIAVYSKNIDEYEAQYRTWEALERKLDDGETVYAPSDTAKKRKRQDKSPRNPRARPLDSFDNSNTDLDSEAGND